MLRIVTLLDESFLMLVSTTFVGPLSRERRYLRTWAWILSDFRLLGRVYVTCGILLREPPVYRGPEYAAQAGVGVQEVLVGSIWIWQVTR